LVQQHVIEDRASEQVARLAAGGDLDRLGDRDSQRAGGVLTM